MSLGLLMSLVLLGTLILATGLCYENHKAMTSKV